MERLEAVSRTVSTLDELFDLIEDFAEPRLVGMGGHGGRRDATPPRHYETRNGLTQVRATGSNQCPGWRVPAFLLEFSPPINTVRQGLTTSQGRKKAGRTRTCVLTSAVPGDRCMRGAGSRISSGER